MSSTDLLKTFGFQSLKNKTVLITGASSGIGLETAKILAPWVKKLVLIARRKDRLDKMQKDLSALCLIDIHAGDITESKFLDELSQKNVFTIDILINNAGLAAGLAPTIDALETDWQQMIDVNIRSAFLVIKKCLNFMIDQQNGHIINLASVAGHTAYAQGGVYCATKHALLAFAKALRSEVCDKNIRVTNISPGMVETEFSLVRFKGDKQRADSVYTGVEPLTGQDIARQILFSLLQPGHVNIDEIYITPLAQGEVTKIHRKPS